MNEGFYLVLTTGHTVLKSKPGFYLFLHLCLGRNLGNKFCFFLQHIPQFPNLRKFLVVIYCYFLSCFAFVTDTNYNVINVFYLSTCS